MSSNENTGSIPVPPDDSDMLHVHRSGADHHLTEQPVTLAGGILGPLETIIEESEETKAEGKK